MADTEISALADGSPLVATDDIPIARGAANYRVRLSAAGVALLDDADAAAQRTTLGLGTIATQAASAVAVTGGTAILTSLETPTINGGTAANDDITIQGTTNATRATSYVILQPTDGAVVVGTTASTQAQVVVNKNLAVNVQNANRVMIGAPTGNENYPGIWFGSAAISLSNYAFLADVSAGQTILNAPTSINFRLGNATKACITGIGLFGVGTTAPDKILEVNLGTENAFRLTYNDANGSAATYMDTTLSSAGVTTFTGAGSAPAFTFAQAVTFGTRANHASFTVGTAPAVGVAGGHVYFSDAAGSPCWGQSNGSVWKRCDDTSVTVT